MRAARRHLRREGLTIWGTYARTDAQRVRVAYS